MIKNAPKLIPYSKTETEISFYLAVNPNWKYRFNIQLIDQIYLINQHSNKNWVVYIKLHKLVFISRFEWNNCFYSNSYWKYKHLKGGCNKNLFWVKPKILVYICVCTVYIYCVCMYINK